MLNAFRHQSGSHPVWAVAGAVGSASAQRLPASKRFAHVFDPFLGSGTTLCSTPSGIKAVRTRGRARRSAPRWGAQRLPASKRFAHRQRHQRAGPDLVLNAFRHQSGFAQHHDRRQRCAESVLNAFRHQSGSHDMVLGTSNVTGTCSTPSGIKAVRTHAPRRGGRARPRVLNAFRHQSGSHGAARVQAPVDGLVLNAFRHQSGSHSIWAAMVRYSARCSTPSGIKAVRTHGLASYWTNPRCAQRLPASKRFAQARFVKLRPRTVSAQRLPASKRFAPRIAPPTDLDILCSTPSGIKAVRTAPV